MPLLPVLRRFVRQTSGQDLIEYVLLSSFVALLVSGPAAGLGTQIGSWFAALASVYESAPAPEDTGGNGKGKGSNCSATGAAASRGKCT